MELDRSEFLKGAGIVTAGVATSGLTPGYAETPPSAGTARGMARGSPS